MGLSISRQLQVDINISAPKIAVHQIGCKDFD
jgi:hypothetical protein